MKPLDFYIIIPAHNEEAYLEKTLLSLVGQTVLPKKVIVVNDHSTDKTQDIINRFVAKHSWIDSVTKISENIHAPGSKVINAFYEGLSLLDTQYDIICKYDADLIFPKNYLEKISEIFQKNQKCGMAGGFCYIEKDGNWVLENLTNKDHIRGALKAYRKECFQAIGGLKNTMGWDTVDELLAKYNNWDVQTINSLHVKHLKPTGKSYNKKAKYKQGEAFYKLRYGKTLTRIASLKLAIKKNDYTYYFDCMRGFSMAKTEKTPFIVSEKEGAFIRNLRWSGIKKKML